MTILPRFSCAACTIYKPEGIEEQSKEIPCSDEVTGTWNESPLRL